MKKFLLFCISCALFFEMGAWWQKTRAKAHCIDKEFPITSQKSFVFVVYAMDDAPWIERSLQSIFDQEYSAYRVIFIDDGSEDESFSIAQDFAALRNVEYLRNEEHQGFLACLHGAVATISDEEIVIPLQARDWLAHAGALARLNGIYQDPDVWEASSSALELPSYESSKEGLHSFYAVLLKGIPQEDFIAYGASYRTPLQAIAKSRSKDIPDILLLSSRTLQD